ncbi:hypothetical protein X975_22397, partial [Stegodyphus mimosarum]
MDFMSYAGIQYFVCQVILYKCGLHCNLCKKKSYRHRTLVNMYIFVSIQSQPNSFLARDTMDIMIKPLSTVIKTNFHYYK